MKTNLFLRVRSSLLVLCFTFLATTMAWGQLSENFDTGLVTSYTTGDLDLASGTWNVQNVFQESGSNSRSGFAARLNDDMTSFLTTPVINGVGEISFWYRELNSGGGTIQIQTSTNGTNFTDVTTQAYSGSTYQNFTYELNQSGNVYIRILADDQPGHLIIDDFSTTAFSGTDPLLNTSPTSLSNLDYIVGEGPSTAQSFEVSGANLDGSDVTVSVPGGSDFEISETEGSGYTNSITLTNYNGTATNIYARLKSGLAIDDYTDTVTISGGDADDITVTLNGTVAPTPPDNDLCADAIALTVNGGITSGTLVNATYAAPFDKADVWYTITPTYDETYTITLSNFTGDLDMFLFNQGSACPTTIDDIAEAYTTNIPEEISIDLEAGTTYYLRVAIYDFEDTFDIEVTAPAPPEPCETPDNQPTNLQFSAVTNNAISGSFTASDADSYLVVISEDSSISQNPVDETTYNADDVLGNGIVVQSSSNTSFTATDLEAETQYYIFVFAYNNECLDGPLYYTITPLNGTATTTDAPAIPIAGTIFITEVADASEYTNEYIEFYNNSDTPIDFTGAKISMDNGTTWEFGDDIDTAIIPARGFIIVNRGANQTTFESEFGALNANTILIQGISGAMYFGTGTARSWQLWYGGTSGNADGDLIDDTVNEVGGSDNRDYQNIFTGDFISDSDENANPGELDYLVYVDGGWVNDVEIDGSTGAEDAIFYDTYTASTTVEINNLYVENGATLEVENVLKVNGDIENEGSIVFKSTSVANTAQLDEFTGAISGNGNFTSERFFPANRAFRLISSPINGVTIYENWQENGNYQAALGTHITGGDLTDGFDQSGSDNPSLFTYDNTLVDQTGQAAWNAVANTNATNIDAGTPYRLFVRGDRSIDLTNNDSPANETIIRTTGSLHTGDFSPTISTVGGNFSFIGNPYQSIVDATLLDFNGDINSNFMYVWDASVNDSGAYVTVDLSANSNDGSTSDANQFLQPGQAVFFRNNETVSTTPEITFTESAKATSETLTTIFNQDEINRLKIRLYTAEDHQNEGREIDAVSMRFSETFSNEVNDFDAAKLGNIDENLALFTDNNLLAIERRAIPEDQEEMQLVTVNYRSDEYVLEFLTEELPENASLIVYDEYLDTETEITSAENTYTFTVDQSISESTNPFRFKVIFDMETFSTETVQQQELRFYPNPVNQKANLYLPNNATHYELAVFDILGNRLNIDLPNLEKSQAQLDLSALSTGVYILKLYGEENQHQIKFIKN